MQSFTRSQAMKVELPDGEAFLVVEFEIDCDVCGKYGVRVFGHHLRALRDLLIEIIALHPELCGSDADVREVKRETFQGRGGGDPSNN